jgi:hypothetical protein
VLEATLEINNSSVTDNSGGARLQQRRRGRHCDTGDNLEHAQQ